VLEALDLLVDARRGVSFHAIRITRLGQMTEE